MILIMVDLFANVKHFVFDIKPSSGLFICDIDGIFWIIFNFKKRRKNQKTFSFLFP